MEYARYRTELGSLAAARAWLAEKRVRGAVCPCCDRVAKVYRRKFNVGMARSLAWLAGASDPERDRPTPGGWVDVPKSAPAHVLRSREFDKLELWRLAEQADADGGKRSSGIWRITAAGQMFVRGRLAVRSHVELYNGEVLDFNGAKVTFREVLPKGFDYDELMRELPRLPSGTRDLFNQ